MDKTTQKKINNNNRKRGAKFEKSVAKILDMDVVPYSGSNARFGYGDVRDSIWLGECKNITPKDNRIKLLIKWFDKNRERAEQANRMPYLAWMPVGKPYKYIVLEEKEFSIILNRVDNTKYDIIIPQIFIYKVSSNNNSINLYINMNDAIINAVNKDKIVGLDFKNHIYYIMNIHRFNKLILSTDLKGDRDGTQL